MKGGWYPVGALALVVFGLATLWLRHLAQDYRLPFRKEWEKRFVDFQFEIFEKDGCRLPYRMYQPPVLERGKTYPLVLFFHGYGERGTDNRRQLEGFVGVSFWEKYPCFVIAPQCPRDNLDENTVWVLADYSGRSHTMKGKPTRPMQMAMDLLDSIISKYPVDPHRIYVTGLSMGGFATWEILQRERGKFAAAMPVCGGGDLAYASNFANLPLWVFHGSADESVKPQRSRDIVAAITAAGGSPKYTEYPGVGHNAWVPTYGNPAVWDWLFAQTKK